MGASKSAWELVKRLQREVVKRVPGELVKRELVKREPREAERAYIIFDHSCQSTCPSLFRSNSSNEKAASCACEES